MLSKAKPQITEDIRDILASSSRAKLFASPQTSQLITKYGSIVMKLRDYLDRGLPTDSVAHEMDQAFKELVNALAAEISEYRHHIKHPILIKLRQAVIAKRKGKKELS